MGVDVRIIACAPDREKARVACAAAFRRIADLDTMMSDYRAQSELMRLCARAGEGPVPVSPDLFLVLRRAQELAVRSEGAFDVTAGPLVRLWREARRTRLHPKPEELRSALAVSGWRRLHLDEPGKTARLDVPGMKLDLGGIAKGYAADCAVAVLRTSGVTSALVEAGGEIVVSGPPPGARGWRVRIPNAGDGPAGVEEVRDCAVSSSGDTEQFVEIEGRRYSHVVDPRTGEALTNRLQVTVIARDGLTSDSLATAVGVLGAEKGRALANHYPGTRLYVRQLPTTEGNP